MLSPIIGCSCLNHAFYNYNVEMTFADSVVRQACTTSFSVLNNNQILTNLAEIFKQGTPIDIHSYAHLLQTCADMKALDQGKQLHTHMLKNGTNRTILLGNKLAILYVKCSNLEDARQVFNEMPQRNCLSWAVIIGGVAKQGQWHETFHLFHQMRDLGLQPNNFIIPSVLRACGNLMYLQEGKDIHDYIIRNRLEIDLFVASALVDMYAKCGSLDSARQVFNKMPQRDHVAWNSMIAGYAHNGQDAEALETFYGMQRAGLEPDLITWNSLIAGYSHIGKTGEALELFNQMQSAGVKPDTVSWTALIQGYSQTACSNQALELFCQMQQAGFKPNSVTIASVLPACANLVALGYCKEIHCYIARNGFDLDIFAVSALIDTYGKCGCLGDAHRLFDKMHQRNTVSWNAIISAYTMHGHGEGALKLFYQMQQENIVPDHITFTSILSACSHAGLVDEGWQFFELMKQEHNISPTMEHCACMVDLLGRAGQLNEAYEFIRKMQVEPDACVWGGLLGACKVYGNVELGERAAKHLFVLEPENTANYVLLSNILAGAGKWVEAGKVRKMIEKSGLKKRPGCSWVEVKNKVHTFIVGDKSHPQIEEIYSMLQSWAGEMKEAGYVPDSNFVLQDVDDDEKEHILCGHSERLAIAFGIISTCHGTSVRVIKNLRVCGDCHTYTKFISKISKREIFVRDGVRFHHFRDGMCSCRDYW